MCVLKVESKWTLEQWRDEHILSIHGIEGEPRCEIYGDPLESYVDDL